MISGDDIEAFQEQSAESLSQASEFARRARKGLPPDRWASARQMYLVASGIDALSQIIAWQSEVIAALTEATTGEANG